MRHLFQLLAVLLGVAMLSSCSRDPQVAKQKFLDRGEAFYQKGDFDSAAIEFRKALQVDSHFGDAQYWLGLADVKLGRWQEAYQAFGHAAELKHNFSEAYRQLAELDLASQKFEDCSQDIARLLQINPSSADAYLLRGRLETEQRQYPDALADFAHAQQLQPQRLNAWNYMAETNMLLGRYQESEKQYRHALDLDPARDTGYLNMARLYQLWGKRDLEIQVLRDGIARVPKAIPLYINLAQIYAGVADNAAVNSTLQWLRTNTGNPGAALVAIGDFYLQSGDYAEAKAALLESREKGSNLAEIRPRLIEAHLGLTDWRDAEELTSQMLRAKPGDPNARVYHARALLAQGKTAEAITSLQNVIKDEPDLSVARFALGVAYRQAGYAVSAVATLKDCISRDPGFTPALIALAEFSLEQKDGNGALAYAADALKQNPGLLAARLTSANAHLMLGNYGDAQQDLRLLYESRPSDPVVLERLGYILFKEGKLSEAQDYLERSLKVKPDFVPPLRDLAELYRQQGKPQQAIVRIQQQIQVSSKQSEFYELLGAQYLHDGDVASAERQYLTAINLNKSAYVSYTQLARIYAGENKLEPAIEYAKMAVDQRPDMVQGYVLLGGLYESAGQTDLANKAYQEALDRDPNDAASLNALAWLYCQHGGDLNQALSLASKAKEAAPKDANYTDTLGWIQYRKGLYESAVQVLREASSMAPEEGLFQFHLGMALAKAGYSSDAKRALRRALDLKLSSSDAQEATREIGVLTRAS